jgi:hypothetical protein
VVLQYGWQDRQTWELRLSLQGLLNSMRKAVQGGYDLPQKGE